ncbi:MAG: type II toxin-antitoxin system HicB family antitoxin [Desulfitobacteriaceae bacterium]
MTNKNFDYYLELPYKYTLYPAEEGGYVIEIPDLPGCISQGETAEDALVMIEDAKRGWLEVALNQGIEIPEPSRVAAIFPVSLTSEFPNHFIKPWLKKPKKKTLA